MIVWAQELGDGRMHVCTDVPFIIAGSAGGAFQTGRFLELGGQNHCHLLDLNMPGFWTEQPNFGDPTAGTGGLAEL